MDDDEETEQYGLRVVGHDFTGVSAPQHAALQVELTHQSLIDRYSQPIAATINDDLIPQRLQRSSDARAQGDPDWWKPLESMLALLGGLADDIRGLLEDAKGLPPIQLDRLFDQVIPGLLDSSGTCAFQAVSRS